ncbi:GvpL/GvpF family gas vesicle protein [Algicella marina]|uniref:GvpL/GvpF family gas vesicle protein n=1 Tax=Algicella marina TaxID=2683284 RepID=A0A6P1T040_9RHOB|nr:GvpL/GvpF family gas vesicle protein [Algicella marina]QHQ36098.1 hypothetical protein GO499_13390 [Algicella marina]
MMRNPAWVVHGIVWRSLDQPVGVPVHRRVCRGDLVLLASVSRMHTPEAVRFPPETEPRRLDDNRTWQRQEAEAALRHSTLLNGYSAAGGVLPFYYGCIVGSCAGLTDLLAQNAGRYRALLRRVDGCTEIHIVVRSKTGSVRAPEQREHAGGEAETARLRTARKLREVAKSTMLQSLIGAVAPLAREVIEGPLRPARPDLMLEAELLVSRRMLRRLTELVKSYALHLEGLDCVVEITGPWPPYAFGHPAGLQTKSVTNEE